MGRKDTFGPKDLCIHRLGCAMRDRSRGGSREKLRLAVVGSSEKTGYSKKTATLVTHLARRVSSLNIDYATGASDGLSHIFVRTVKSLNPHVRVVGFSHAKDMKSHEGDFAPSDSYDRLIFTGKGLAGRSIDLIENADAVLVLGGGSGTLLEILIAYKDSKKTFVVQGTKGVADNLKRILRMLRVPDKKSISFVTSDSVYDHLARGCAQFTSREPDGRIVRPFTDQEM